jgi:hypothetical protein
MKCKGVYFADVFEIHEAVTDELKKVQEEEFSAAFQEFYDRTKACIHVYDNGANYEFKKVCVYFMCRRFKKKSVLKFLGDTVYVGL